MLASSRALSSRSLASSSPSSQAPSLPGGDEKVIACVLLAFGDRQDLEEDFQKEHAAGRARYDAIRALLRLAAWLGFTARAAAAQASAGMVAVMALASILYSLLPLALLALSPDVFLSWRRYWLTAWNVGHAAMVLLFCPQLYQLLPPGTPTGTICPAAHAEHAVPLCAALGQLLWLLWHSQALIMALNAAGPLTNPFRHFLQGQLMILMLHAKLNPLHCTRHPHMLAAVRAVHARFVSPLAALLLGNGASLRAAAAPTPAPQQLCAIYLPTLQLGLGLVLPCCLVYRQERALRRRFLAARHMRMGQVYVRQELAAALLAAAIQLAALATLEYRR